MVMPPLLSTLFVKHQQGSQRSVKVDLDKHEPPGRKALATLELCETLGKSL